MTPSETGDVTVEPSLELDSLFNAVRSRSSELCDALEPDDFLLQSMPDASPPKWHLGHTTWFFETFVLAAADESYVPFDPSYGYLFNSYYESVGARHVRAERGILSRPTLGQIMNYRKHVDARMNDLLASDRDRAKLDFLIELGLQHEQQHQELLLTDIKHAFSRNSLLPAYRDSLKTSDSTPPTDEPWLLFEPGIRDIGHAPSPDGFAFDNESPRHRVFLEPFEIQPRLVTCGEFLEFMADGGYERPEFWLSEGWDRVNRESWTAPLYWNRDGSNWMNFTLGGLRQVDHNAPVTHVSLFEADAYASWAGCRLPFESEWEVACGDREVEGNFYEAERLHPAAATRVAPQQFFGDAWEWTLSSYSPYPGYRQSAGALGEYNGKFMCNQYVLRGGSCVSPRSHLRRSYRNFFPAHVRWQFSGIRLVRQLQA